MKTLPPSAPWRHRYERGRHPRDSGRDAHHHRPASPRAALPHPLLRGPAARSATGSSPKAGPARVAVMLALAHKLQQAIDRGDLRDQADAARRLGFNRARITQLFDLTLLAPDIQEQILIRELVDGVEPITERAVRRVVRASEWGEQRGAWQSIQTPTS